VRVLVTGAFGYLGLAAVRRLSRTHQVVATGHPPRAAIAPPPGVRTVEADLDAIDSIVTNHGPFTAVLHLAGGGGPAKIDSDAVAAVRTNIRGTARLAAAIPRGIRLLFASTIQVYGTHRGGTYRETDPTAPDDLYGAVKESAELIVQAAGGTALRIANIYGAGAGVDLGIQGVCERFARAAAAGGDITIYGDGAQKIDLVHIDDVLDAIERALSAAPGVVLPPALNLGGGAPQSIGTIASAALAGAHKLGAGVLPRIVAREPPPGPPKLWPDRSLAIGLAQNVLAWRPHVKLQTGFDELVAMMHRSLAA
jgi:UDP-glucose 4-epimerase